MKQNKRNAFNTNSYQQVRYAHVVTMRIMQQFKKREIF